MRIEVERWEGDYRNRTTVEGTFDECQRAIQWLIPRFNDARKKQVELGEAVDAMVRGAGNQPLGGGV